MRVCVVACASIAFFSLAANRGHCQDADIYKSGKAISEMLRDSSADNFSFAAWYYSFIGRYRESLICFDKSGETKLSLTITDEVRGLSDTYEQLSAVDFILNRSPEERVIIINEAHHQPMHRIFTESLLEGLYKNGYRYLGLEAIAEDSVLNIRKWPSINDGFYTAEPQFGNLIRKALEIGFTIFGYESTEKGRDREIGQAKNIEKILKKDPSAKILVHCGFSHVVEERHPRWGRGMAGELKRITGVDPFTIDQVEFSEHALNQFESLPFRQLTVKTPTVLINKNKEVFNASNDSSVSDIKIFHPRTQFVIGRPDWLMRNHSWKTVPMDQIKLTGKFPLLVSAFRAGEDPFMAVPVDQIEVNYSSEMCLILSQGSYNISIREADGKRRTKKIVVP